MILAMAGFATADTFIKLAARSLSIGQIVFWTSVMAAIFFAILTLAARRPILSPLFFHPAVLIRNTAEIVGSLCIISALSLAPLSLVSAIGQANPLVVTLGAELFLGEKVGPRRWMAVIAGLAGVLIILRPDATGVSLGALLAVGSVFGLSARDLATRRVPRDASTLQLATYGFSALIPAGAVFMWLSPAGGTLTPLNTAMLIGATAGAAVGYYAITSAMRLGDVSMVAPFRYSRLVFALVIGILLFGERPDAWTLIGAAIVIVSGIYVFARERQLARRAAH